MKSDKTFSQTPTSGLAYRVTIPVGVLSLYGIMAGLWLSSSRALYFDALRLLGVEPFSFPFLDAHAVLAAAECSWQGMDVYLSNPCDTLGRPHAYSPLWLAIVPAHLGVDATWWVGASLGVLFILSWPLVLRPRGPKELLILGSAAISPMTVYALERANNDLVVFLLVVCGGIMFTWSRPLRLFAYGPFIAGGLLKYYPFVLLVLVARESRRDVLVVATATGFALGIFGVVLGADLRTALANIPTASSYFTDAFSARNLPFGFAEALGGGISHTFIAVPLIAALTGRAIARMLRTMRLIGRERLDWTTREAQFLVIGGLLITACFFAAQNVDYRGIFLLPVISGLVCLRRSVRDREVRRFFGQMIVAALFVMWEECVRRALHAIVSPAPSEGLSSRVEVLFWLGRELVWWWLVIGLVALVLSCLRRSSWAEMFIRTAISSGPSLR